MLTQEDISRIAGDAIEWARNKDEMDEDCKTCFMFGIQFLRDWLIRETKKDIRLGDVAHGKVLYGEPYAETTIPLSQLDQVQIIDEKYLLYLPDMRCYISTKDIRSISRRFDDDGHLYAAVLWNNRDDSRYYGEDARTIWKWAEEGRVNPE